jgi:acetoin utilization deacetylase AcuC-like enzyme
MGFCFFNNVAIAAKHSLEKYSLKRVAIIDFDVHHGNGTEIAFMNDSRVLMCSFFQHPFYPYSGALENNENMMNIPVPAYTDGETIRHLVETHWLPKLRKFKPEFIFISAGFDAHREDEMGQLNLVEADYAWITRQLMAVANESSQGRIVSCLEGGYHLSALARSVAAHIKELVELS